MKKIYTLIAGAMLAGSALAINPAGTALKVGELDANALKSVNVEKILSSNVMDPLTAQVAGNHSNRFKAQDSKGQEWACLFAIADKLPDILFRNPLDFKEFPYYRLIVATQPYSDSQDMLNFYISWPCVAAAQATEGGHDELWDEVEGGLALNEEKCIEMFGSLEKAYAPISYDDLYALREGDMVIPMRPGLYYATSILSSEITGPSVTWNETKYMAIPCSYGSDDRLNLQSGTYLDWSKLDLETSDIDCDFTFPYADYTQNAQGGYTIGTQKGIGALQLSGAAVLLGFSDISFDNIGEVHIFNGGRMTFGASPESWLYQSFDSPLTFYFLCFADAGWGYMATNGNTGESLQNFTNNSLPRNESIGIGAPSYRFTTDSPLNFLHATLWAAENSEVPYGKWSMAKSDYTENEQTGAITYKSPAKAYNLVEALDCSAGINDGFYGCYEGYTVRAVPEDSWIGVGDKTYGMNFKFSASMTNGKYITGSFKGDILYHPTPNKWLDDMTRLPAVGNNDFNVQTEGNTSDPGSVKGIASDAPVVATSYYNFQGQRLASEPQQGIYIVRSVKADGSVVSKKVAK